MRPVYVYAVPGERHALVRGRVGRWFAAQRIPAYRSPLNNGWWLRQERVPDVIARLEVDGYAVTFAPHIASRHVPPTRKPEVAA